MFFLHSAHITAVALWLTYCLYLVIEGRYESMSQELKNNNQINQPAKVAISWGEYELYAKFYKFFLDFGLKANVFFYGITGAILAILYNRSSSSPGGAQSIKDVPTSVRTVLLVTPFLIGVVLAVAFMVGAYLWVKIASQVYEGLKERDEKFKVSPRLNYLTFLLISFGFIFIFVSCCLCYIMLQSDIFNVAVGSSLLFQA
jgi:hypothetical protein